MEDTNCAGCGAAPRPRRGYRSLRRLTDDGTCPTAAVRSPDVRSTARARAGRSDAGERAAAGRGSPGHDVRPWPAASTRPIPDELDGLVDGLLAGPRRPRRRRGHGASGATGRHPRAARRARLQRAASRPSPGVWPRCVASDRRQGTTTTDPRPARHEPRRPGGSTASASGTRGAWRTPLGDVEVDEDLAADDRGARSAVRRSIARRTRPSTRIEVQLPFVRRAPAGRAHRAARRRRPAPGTSPSAPGISLGALLAERRAAGDG